MNLCRNFGHAPSRWVAVLLVDVFQINSHTAIVLAGLLDTLFQGNIQFIIDDSNKCSMRVTLRKLLQNIAICGQDLL